VAPLNGGIVNVHFVKWLYLNLNNLQVSRRQQRNHKLGLGWISGWLDICTYNQFSQSVSLYFEISPPKQKNLPFIGRQYG
jgi:hypothetical protein